MLQNPMPDIASRVYNHAFKLDPIVRSLLDTDVYKLLMLQTIWKERPNTPVTFSVLPKKSMKKSCALSWITLVASDSARRKSSG